MKSTLAEKNDCLSLEDSLLILCARTRLSNEQASQIFNLAQQGVDWDQVIHLAKKHGVVPLVYQRLQSCASSSVPEMHRSTLQQHFQRNAQQSLFLASELFKVLELLQTHGLPVLIVKGLVMAEVIYGNLSSRQAGDLDLVVRWEDRVKAVEVLTSRGYLSKLHPNSRQEQATLKNDGELPLRADHPRRHLDLHTSLTQPDLSFASWTEELWGRVNFVHLKGVPILVPTVTNEDLCLYICMHGAKHGWNRLKWICDLAELIRNSPRLDWPYIEQKATELNIRTMLHVGLYLAADILGAALPIEIEKRLADDPKISLLAQKSYDLLLSEKNEDQSKIFWFYISVLSSPSDRLRSFVKLLKPTAEEWQMLPLSSSYPVLGYALRPLRLTSKYGGRLFRRREKQT